MIGSRHGHLVVVCEKCIQDCQTQCSNATAVAQKQAQIYLVPARHKQSCWVLTVQPGTLRCLLLQAEALSEKINNSRPSTGAPSTNTDSMKSLNTTDGNL